MHDKPANIIVIKTDQQRADTIAALGNSHMITPNLDRLVAESVCLTNAFCCGATCIPSRAAFYTGQYAHNTGCYSFDDWAHNRTWLHELRDAGYQTVALGKVHHSPHQAMMAFNDRLFVENFPIMQGHFDDYANYLKAEGKESGCKLMTRDGRWLDKCTSDVFPMDEKYHVDQYVGRMATRWINDREDGTPFYLHIGFQGPHDPFDPPQRFLDMYRERDLPVPHIDEGGLESRPPHYRRLMQSALDSGKDFSSAPAHGTWATDLSDKSEADLQRMRRHYYAEITQIDEQIGHIMNALNTKELLDNTLIIFTSDHGDNLADHGLMYKWLMTDQAIRVPMLVRLPGGCRGGVVDDNLFTQMDIGPTILTALGMEVPQRLDGRSNWRRLNKGVDDETPRRVYCEDNYLTMVRSRDRKLILYAGQEVEEYFNLEDDPWEERNLADDPEMEAEILRLKAETLDWLMTSRYLGSLSHIGRPNEQRKAWPANHPDDPYFLHGRKQDKTKGGNQ